METRSVVAVALAVLFVTAGCQAPAAPQASTDTPTESTATDTPTTTEPTTTQTTTTTETNLVEVSDPLPYNVSRIYHRVGGLMDVPQYQRPPTQVEVKAPPEGGSRGTASTSGFVEVIGIEPLPSEGEDGGVITGAITRGTSVTLYDHPNASDRRQEYVLAHEFVHVLQSQMDVRQGIIRLDFERNRLFLSSVLVEGSAEYVQERYSMRYQNASIDQTAISDRWKNASAYVRWRIAPYEYGSRYFAMRVDNASQVQSIYRNPPRTTEQVVHGYGPAEEPAKDISIDVQAESDDVSLRGRTTKGELFTRIALSSELDWQRAADAAEGWGMDRLLTFQVADGKRGYAWVLRWDDAGEAQEFDQAFEAYADQRETAFDAERVGDETVVVFAGYEDFVATASASGNSSSVTVTA
jgi:hypothetical protein